MINTFVYKPCAIHGYQGQHSPFVYTMGLPWLPGAPLSICLQTMHNGASMVTRGTTLPWHHTSTTLNYVQRVGVYLPPVTKERGGGKGERKKGGGREGKGEREEGER